MFEVALIITSPFPLLLNCEESSATLSLSLSLSSPFHYSPSFVGRPFFDRNFRLFTIAFRVREEKSTHCRAHVGLALFYVLVCAEETESAASASYCVSGKSSDVFTSLLSQCES